MNLLFNKVLKILKFTGLSDYLEFLTLIFYVNLGVISCHFFLSLRKLPDYYTLYSLQEFILNTVYSHHANTLQAQDSRTLCLKLVDCGSSLVLKADLFY